MPAICVKPLFQWSLHLITRIELIIAGNPTQIDSSPTVDSNGSRAQPMGTSLVLCSEVSFRDKSCPNVSVYIQSRAFIRCVSVCVTPVRSYFHYSTSIVIESKDQNWEPNDKQVRDVLIRNGIKLSLKPMFDYCYRTESNIETYFPIRSAIIPNVIHLNTKTKGWVAKADRMRV